ncbi:hypothetical protein HY642_06335 [Candidatus Woesearchaeota archaeon]|nr:hypothetical protein [Candidatus Woesearchaeota archaeon]
MNKQLRNLIDFAAKAKGFDLMCKAKIILFAAGLKPNTYLTMKVNATNLDEKDHFEQHLTACKFIFNTSKAKSFEEIDSVKANVIRWSIKGIWFGYDLFRNRKEQERFAHYVSMVEAGDRAGSDVFAGKLYGYPACCIKTHTRDTPYYIGKHYTYHQYHWMLHEGPKRYPFLSHTPCTVDCKQSAALNKKYSAAVKKLAPKVWKDFTRKRSYTTDLIVDVEHDIVSEFGGGSIWQHRDGHDYSVISRKPFEGKYYLYHYLSKEYHSRGTLLKAKVTMFGNTADITVFSAKPNAVKDLHHQRKLLLMGRRY